MLPKAHRLRHWRDFEAVYQSRRSRRTRHLTLKALRTASPRSTKSTKEGTPPQGQHQSQVDAPVAAGSQATRVGIVVGRKVSKKATIRNRIKRRLRACMRQLLPSLSPGWQLVVMARPAALECDYAQFLRELEQMLAEAEVLNGDSRGRIL
ncbi:MAG: ribonuclease P protein component [Hormoscilla sp. GM7CHS1pb]|nr:ribonuclease P protein component [Hormoscilla sp. GM7CHS1pb]